MSTHSLAERAPTVGAIPTPGPVTVSSAESIAGASVEIPHLVLSAATGPGHISCARCTRAFRPTGWARLVRPRFCSLICADAGIGRVM